VSATPPVTNFAEGATERYGQLRGRPRPAHMGGTRSPEAHHGQRALLPHDRVGFPPAERRRAVRTTGWLLSADVVLSVILFVMASA